MIMAPASLRRTCKSVLLLTWQDEINTLFATPSAWHTFTESDGESVTFSSVYLSLSVYADVAQQGGAAVNEENEHLIKLRAWLDGFAWTTYVDAADKGLQLLIVSGELSPGEVEFLMYDDFLGMEDDDETDEEDEDDEEEPDEEEPDDEEFESLVDVALASGELDEEEDVLLEEELDEEPAGEMFVPLVDHYRASEEEEQEEADENEVDFFEDSAESHSMHEDVQDEDTACKPVLETEVDLVEEPTPVAKTTSAEKDFLAEIRDGLGDAFLTEYDASVSKETRQLTVIVEAPINGTTQTLTLQFVAAPTTLLSPDRTPLTVIEVREASGMVPVKRFLNAKQAISYVEAFSS